MFFYIKKATVLYLVLKTVSERSWILNLDDSIFNFSPEYGFNVLSINEIKKSNLKHFV